LTGPAPGKIAVRSLVELEKVGSTVKVEPCEVYVHIKGYSRARVTHVDLESPLLEGLTKGRRGIYVTIYGLKDGFIVKPMNGRAFKSIRVKWEGPKILKAGEVSVAFMGGKQGGVYLGFKRKVIKVLEGYAKKLGMALSMHKRR